MKRLLIFSAFLLIPCALHAQGVAIDSFTVVPNEIYALKSTPVVISAHVSHPSTLVLKKVNLRRLQADGNFTKVAEMRDDGSHGDLVKNDGTYTIALKLKEPIAGMLAYQIELVFSNNVSPMYSKPLFIKVIGKPWGS